MIKKVYEAGEIFEPSVLDITPDVIKGIFKKTASNMAAVSLATGYITKPAIPHIIANSFKNLAAITFSTDATFPLAEKMKEAAKNAVVVAAPVATKSAPAEKPKEEPKEEAADVDMGGLFGDDDGY